MLGIVSDAFWLSCVLHPSVFSLPETIYEIKKIHVLYVSDWHILDSIYCYINLFYKINLIE